MTHVPTHREIGTIDLQKDASDAGALAINVAMNPDVKYTLQDSVRGLLMNAASPSFLRCSSQRRSKRAITSGLPPAADAASSRTARFGRFAASSAAAPQTAPKSEPVATITALLASHPRDP
jgi:hypothetical protein